MNYLFLPIVPHILLCKFIYPDFIDLDTVDTYSWDKMI